MQTVVDLVGEHHFRSSVWLLSQLGTEENGRLLAESDTVDAGWVEKKGVGMHDQRGGQIGIYVRCRSAMQNP